MLDTKNSEKLYKQFKDGGIELLRSLKTSNTTESEILDFKLPKNGQAPLEVEDKANLAKAISGFANTHGGILVWGIYCFEDENGSDRVQDLRPICNLSAFKSGVHTVSSQLTSPAVQGIEFFCIFEDEAKESGYLVMHIPKSAALVESLFKKCKGFYERAGTSFIEMADSRLVAKAKHVPLSKRLVPYMRAFGVYVVILLFFAIGFIVGGQVVGNIAYKKGLSDGIEQTQKERVEKR